MDSDNSSLWLKIFEFVSFHKKIVGIVGVAVFALTLPVTVILIGQRQTITQQAAPTDTDCASCRNQGKSYVCLDTATNTSTCADGPTRTAGIFCRFCAEPTSPPTPTICPRGACPVATASPTPTTPVGGVRSTPAPTAVRTPTPTICPRGGCTIPTATRAPSPTAPCNIRTGCVTITPTLTVTPTTPACVRGICPSSTPTTTAIPTIPCGIRGGCPTATATPTVTTPPGGAARLSLTIRLPGIGTSSANLRNPNRQVTILLFNSSEQLVTSVLGTLTHNQNGVFSGSIALPQQFQAGNFIIKLKLNNTLVKRAPGIFNIQTGAVDIPPLTLVSGDINGDNKLDLTDYNTVAINCFGNRTCDKKEEADLNGDGAVEELDVNILQRGFAQREGD